MLYGLLKFILSPIVRFLWIRKVSGLANLPATGPYILASNHESNLDPLVISCIISQRLYYLTGEKFYKFALFRWLMNSTKQIYVDRRSHYKPNVYLETRDHLENGGVVAIFPEGTRTRSGQIGKAFRGVGRLALQNKVDIVPVAISGTFELYPPGKTFPKLGKRVKLSVLPPVLYNDIKELSEETITHDIVMRQIADANKEVYEYDKR